MAPTKRKTATTTPSTSSPPPPEAPPPRRPALPEWLAQVLILVMLYLLGLRIYQKYFQ